MIDWVDHLRSRKTVERCKGKFCVHEFVCNSSKYDDDAQGKYRFYNDIRDDMIKAGKMEWFVNNNFNIIPSVDIVINDIRYFEPKDLHVAVFVDLPDDLRTLFKLTF